MSQQSKTGVGVATPVSYSPSSEEILDTNPSDYQPPGVDEKEKEPQSLEEALTG